MSSNFQKLQKKAIFKFCSRPKRYEKKREARNFFFTKKSMDLWPSSFFRIFSCFPIPLIISYNMKINIIHFDHTAITTNLLLLFLSIVYCMSIQAVYLFFLRVNIIDMVQPILNFYQLVYVDLNRNFKNRKFFKNMINTKAEMIRQNCSENDV